VIEAGELDYTLGHIHGFATWFAEAYAPGQVLLVCQH